MDMIQRLQGRTYGRLIPMTAHTQASSQLYDKIQVGRDEIG